MSCRKRIASAIESHESKEWLNYSLFGDVVEGANFASLSKNLVNNGLPIVRLGFVGASKVLLTFGNIGVTRNTIDTMHVILSQTFSNVKPWSIMDVAVDCFCWVEFFGLPLSEEKKKKKKDNFQAVIAPYG
jgi:hypothetical protein